MKNHWPDQSDGMLVSERLFEAADRRLMFGHLQNNRNQVRGHEFGSPITRQHPRVAQQPEVCT
jgi:hypothetical protein